MPTSAEVPETIRRSVARAVALHNESPLPGTYGFKTAEALASGAVSEAVLYRMARFFTLVPECSTCEDTDPTARSFLLHGAEAGKELCRDYMVEESPLEALFGSPAASVQECLSGDAWLYEYDLNPTSAGKFAVEYFKRTGSALSLVECFGPFAAEVEREAFRLYGIKDPVLEAVELMDGTDIDYVDSAAEDLDDLTDVETSAILNESLPWATVGTLNKQAAAKMVWPGFIAYFILAVEAPDLLKSVHHGKIVPPSTVSDALKNWHQYTDAVNVGIMYFHFKGTHYIDPTGEEKFEGIDSEIITSLHAAFRGRRLNGSQIRKMLGKARRWTAKNGLAGSMFHVYIADWNKGNWQHILDAIPANDDVREAFASFVAQGAKPAHGIKLQQTLSAADAKKAVQQYVIDMTGESADYELNQAKMQDTLFGTAAEEAGTPVGVYSLIKLFGVQYVTLCAAKAAGNVWIVSRNKLSGKLLATKDAILATGLDDGDVKVLQAHYEHAGTSYAAKTPDTVSAPLPGTLPAMTTDKEVVDFAKTVGVPAAAVPPAPVPPPVSIKGVSGPLAKFLIDTFGVAATKFVQVPLHVTTASTAWKELTGKDLLLGTEVKTFATGKVFAARAAFYLPAIEATDDAGETVEVNDTIVVFVLGNDYIFESSDDVADHITNKLIGPAVEAPKAPTPPKFKPGDIVSMTVYSKKQNMYVVDVGPELYWLQSLRLQQTPLVPVSFLHSTVDLYATLAAHPPGSLQSYEYVEGDNFHKVPIPKGWSATEYTQMTYEGKSGWLLGACSSNMSGPSAEFVYPVFGMIAMVPEGSTKAVPYLKTQVLPAATFASAVMPTYTPASSAPEPSMVDAKEADPEMCGTQEAIDKAGKLSWAMAGKSENTGFVWPLGAVLKYGDKHRVIIGYAFNASKVPIYVIKTDTGVVNFKTTKEGNASYGPQLTTNQGVVDSLKPKPTSGPALPKLNYKLGKEALELAKKGMIFEPAPKPSPFYVGSKLMSTAGSVFRLVGWTKNKNEKVIDPSAVMMSLSGDWTLVTAGVLASNYSLTYDYTSAFDPDAGVFQVGKNVNDAALGIMAPGCSLPCALPEGWDSPDSIDTPSFPDLESGKHASAGIVVVLPPGTNIGNGTFQHVLADPAVVLTRPLNGFGGYTLTFPKGTLDKGESVVKAAVREVWEETGLTAAPVLCLGMFKGNNSTTCMYLGYATGGDLKKAGKETDAVAIHVLTGFSKSDMTPAGLVASLPWAKELVDRDKAILSSAIAHLVEYGMPKAVFTNKAENDVQVSQPIDTVGKATYNPHATYVCKQADGYQSLIDYPLSQAAINTTPTFSVPKPEYIIYWTNALPYLNKGYPPPGVKVGVQGSDIIPEYVVAGYVKSANAAMSDPLEAIMLEAEGTTHMLSLKAYGPEKFIPVVSQELAKESVSIPADAATDEVWETLYKKMPFPMTTALVSALKRAWLNTAVAQSGVSATPDGVSGTKAGAGGLSYGLGFTTEKGEKFIAMGFINLSGKLKSGSDSSYWYQLAIGMDGDAAAFEVKGSDFTGFTHDSSVTDSAKIPDPWYTHPDPLVNGTIQKVYANGGDLEALGVSMKTFKEKWLKEAGIPYYAVASYTIITDIASLFVPGVATKFQCDAVIACLKKRMQLTQKKGKKTLVVSSSTVWTAPTTTVPVAPDTVSASLQVPAPDLTSPAWALTTEVVASTSSTLIYGKSVGGGSKPNYIASMPNGTQWFVKPAPSTKEKFRPAIDVAAYKLCNLVVPSIPVAHGLKDGMPASIQPFIAGAVPLNEGDVSGLSDTDKAVVLAQHAADMFIGDHDGHYGNWMRGTDGKLYAIDKGQAFKFLLKGGVVESLMPGWTPPGNFGTHLAKELLLNWSKGKATIPASAFAAFYGAILKVVDIPSGILKNIITSMCVHAGFSIQVRDKLYDDLHDRQISYSNVWTSVMIHLAEMRGEKWKWPTPVNTAYAGGAAPILSVPEIEHPDTPPVKAEPMVLDKAAMDLGFGQKEATALTIANQSKWQGMSVQVDKDAIENQEVHVKCVKYSSTATPEQKATLIHFRVGRAKGLQAESLLLTKAKVVTGSAAGPQQLPFDNSGSGEKYWGIIQSGVKTINHHLYDAKDGKPNPDTINKVASILPELAKIRETTKNPNGKYQGVSNEAVNLMATAYVGYCETIISMAANAAQLIGQKADVMFPFLWQEKKTKAEEAEEGAADIVVKKILKSGFSPSASPMGQEVAVKGTDAPLWNPGGTQSQFMIEVKSVPGARLYYAPPHGEEGYSDIKSYFGQAWAIIPGAPSPSQVATLLKIFEKATGLPMSVSSTDDNEFLYLSKQAFLLQDEGDGIEPDKYGEAVKNSSYKEAVGLYAVGNTSKALAILRSHVASKFGTTPDKLSEVPGYNLKQKANVGGGYIRHSRLGWTRSKLVSFLGNVFFAHSVTGKTLTEFFKQLAAHNGALLANIVKPYHGVQIGGTGSPSADALCGGAVNIFGCMRKGFIEQSGVLYFDPSIFLRTDVYVIGSGDSFGNVTATRYTTPEAWKQHKLNSAHGSVSTGSQWQFNARHDIDIQTYLHTVILDSASERDAVRALCQERGWTKFANGRTLEQVVTLRGDATL